MGSLHHRWQLLLVAVLFCLCYVESKATQVGGIISGENEEQQRFPYNVVYDLESNKGFLDRCAGVIIGERTILTAAQCFDWDFDKIERIKIFLGYAIVLGTDSYVVHESYRCRMQNNIALIKLPHKLQFNQYIQPAKLPKPDNLYVNKNAVALGRSTSNGGLHNWHKNVKTLSNEQCQSLLSSAKKFYSHWLCTETKENIPCHHLPGSPLIDRNPDGSSTVIGIDAICSPNRPNVYTRVSSFLNWIAQHSNES